MLRSFVRSLHIKPNRLLLSKDETCFVAYHYDVEYEFQNTKPIPEARKTENTILRENSKDMITKAPNLEQVQALTYTPARYWLQYEGREKRRKYREQFNDNVDRPGLTS